MILGWCFTSYFNFLVEHAQALLVFIIYVFASLASSMYILITKGDLQFGFRICVLGACDFRLEGIIGYGS